MYRQYRIGELPDIQIDFKDMLLPLMAIVRVDATIATEIFVEVFKELYKDQKDKQVREALGNGLRAILDSSKLYDYSVINCAHRIAIELLKIDGFTIDSGVIERTGEHSMSFQTSLILLEESLIRGDLSSGPDQERTNKRK
jgi:DNA-dependent protein kinase catalytic subunit